jgi:epimerase transport system membrane fusion protein
MTVIAVQAGSGEGPSTNYRPYVVFGMAVLFLTFGLFGVWSVTAPIASAVLAPGQVKVEARRKTIQHLEGGIVSEIAVKDGDRVEAGQVLLKLSDVKARAQLDIVRLQLFEALGLEARLNAERKDADEILFPEELTRHTDVADVREIVRSQTQVFHARRTSSRKEHAILEQRMDQLREQIKGLEALTVSERTRIKSYRGEVKEWQSLYEEQLADKLRLLQIKRELAQLEGNEAAHQADIARLGVQIGETESQLILRDQSRLSEVVEQLRKTQASIADLRTRIVALEDELERTVIRSPVRGTVVGLSVHTIGAVVNRGTPIMEIVPLSDDFVVEAMVKPNDIDQVTVGMGADLRFSAFDLRLTSVIPGTVVTVSADAFQNRESHYSYYTAEIRIDPQGLKLVDQYGFHLVPGMPVEAVIRTGERTLLDYVVKPFADMFARAFRET